MNDQIPKPRSETTPLSTILQDREASIRLHKFLLGSFDENLSTTIPVADRAFEVRIINLNPAPPIRGAVFVEKPETPA